MDAEQIDIHVTAVPSGEIAQAEVNDLFVCDPSAEHAQAAIAEAIGGAGPKDSCTD